MVIKICSWCEKEEYIKNQRKLCIRCQHIDNGLGQRSKAIIRCEDLRQQIKDGIHPNNTK